MSNTAGTSLASPPASAGSGSSRKARTAASNGSEAASSFCGAAAAAPVGSSRGAAAAMSRKRSRSPSGKARYADDADLAKALPKPSLATVLFSEASVMNALHGPFCRLGPGGADAGRFIMGRGPDFLRSSRCTPPVARWCSPKMARTRCKKKPAPMSGTSAVHVCPDFSRAACDICAFRLSILEISSLMSEIMASRSCRARSPLNNSTVLNSETKSEVKSSYKQFGSARMYVAACTGSSPKIENNL